MGTQQTTLGLATGLSSLTQVFRKLNPKLSPADQFDVIKVSTDAVYPLPLGNISPNLKKKDQGIVNINFCDSFMITDQYPGS